MPAAHAELVAADLAEQIIAHHDWVLSHAIHPGGQVRLIRADNVFR